MSGRSLNIMLFLGLFCMGCIICSYSNGPTHRIRQVNAVFKHTDSLAFYADSTSGWGSYYFYVNGINDSLRFEVILYRNITNTSIWANESRVGILSSGYAPFTDQQVIGKEADRQWRITLKPNGDCLFYLLSGSTPQGNHVVVPIQTQFKNR